MNIALKNPIAPAMDHASAYLQAKYGPNFRAILGLGEPGSQPHAETDDSAFWNYFGDLDCDPAPDLTAHNRSTAMMPGVGQ